MGWALLDDNFPFHPKVLVAVKAHQLARDLFVCGLCYCRKYRTSGFISDLALSGLGLAVSAKKPAEALALAGLWDRVPGGFQVHGYHEQYDDAGERDSIDEQRRRRQEAGRKGGLSRAARQASNPQANFQGQGASASQANGLAKQSSTLQAHRTGLVQASVVVSEKEERGEPPFDEWLARLQADYPQHRVTNGYTTGTAFLKVLTQHREGPFVAWALMKSNLENQKRGYEWRVKRMVPKLVNWLEEGTWLQQHDENPPEAVVGNKSMRTLASGAAFIKDGEE